MSENIKRMTFVELAQKILSLSDDEEFTFAIDCSNDDGSGNYDELDCSNWFYIQKRSNPSYESFYWVIDWCGGGLAAAYPIDDDTDDYDVAHCVREYLESYEGPVECVYVETEES